MAKFPEQHNAWQVRRAHADRTEQMMIQRVSTDMNKEWINGTVVKGHGVASGRSDDPRFPNGTIRLQVPYFMERGIDLSQYWPGTLNVDIAPVTLTPKYSIFDGRIAWHADFDERFVLSPIEAEIKGSRYAGLWYYPHPETKTEHFQKSSVVELLLPWIDGVTAGDFVTVKFSR